MKRFIYLFVCLLMLHQKKHTLLLILKKKCVSSQTDLDTIISEMKQRVHQRKGNMQELNNSAAACLVSLDNCLQLSKTV